MHPSRNERISKENNTFTRRIRRWTMLSLGLVAVIICVYTAWGLLKEQSTLESANESQMIDLEPAPVQEPSVANKHVVEEVDYQEVIDHTELDITEDPIVEILQEISLAFVGDIMMGANVGKLLINQGYDYPYVNVNPILSEADIAAGNLENPITDQGEPADKSYVFRTSPNAVPGMVNSGFDIFNLANNHILDYGEIGLDDTIRALAEAGLYGVGAGKDQEEAYKPVVIEKNGIRVAYVGLSRVVPDISWKADKHKAGVAETYNYTRPIKAIEAANEISDMVVVMVHWGVEGALEPRVEEKELAHRYIDAGADLVIGSHPHVLQGFEYYKGKWIAYSLGNFIFTTSGKSGTNETAIVNARCSKSGECELNVIPHHTGIAQPKRMTDIAAKELFQHITNISYSAEVQEDGQVRAMTSASD